MTGRPPRPGDQVGVYRIEGVLGAGGMGTVYAATDLRLRRPAAVKVMLGHLAQEPEFRARFQREAAVLARLDSAHVLAIYDHGEHDGWPYIATQYAAGGDLGSYLARAGPPPPRIAAEIGAQVAEALADAHRAGVIHRDVKPGNVLLRDSRFERPHAYLSDFGIASTGTEQLTAAGEVPGTWDYLAPERSAGVAASPASDIYAVGCLLWETLRGSPPYPGTPVQTLLGHSQGPLPQLVGTDPDTQRLDQVLRRALAKDPAERHPTADALARELREIAEQVGTQVPRRRPSGRRRKWAVAVVATLAAVTTGAALALRGPADNDPPTRASPEADPAATDDPAVTGDFDGDGHGDLLVADGQTNEPVLDPRIVRWNGDGFDVSEPHAEFADAQRAGDFDGDGQTEGLAVDYSEIPPVARVIDTGPSEPSSLEFRVRAGRLDRVWVSSADVDGDGREDVVVLEYNKEAGEVRAGVARSLVDGGWSEFEIWYQGDGWNLRQTQLATGDVDGDGRDDIAVPAFHVREVRVLRSTGDSLVLGEEAGGVDPVPVRGPMPFALWAGDVDGDGRHELVTLRFQGSPRLDELVVHRRDGDGWQSMAVSTTATVEAGWKDAAMTDVEGDGVDELAVRADDSIVLLRLDSGSIVASDFPVDLDPRLTNVIGPNT